MIKIGTLFSGGLAAVEWAMKYEEFEHEIVFACEWDKYARNSYLAFHGEPTSNFYEDVSDMDGSPYSGGVDLMVWGSPCQDLSIAGKRKGFDGEKSSLFREGARIMSEVMPKSFIFENVKGLLSSNGGEDYKEVEKTFREMGYHMAMKVVNAKEQGTAQNRERVFVVGFLDLDEYHNFHFADNVPLNKCLRDYLEYDVDEKYYLSQKMIDYVMSSGTKSFYYKPEINLTIARPLTATMTKMHRSGTDNYVSDDFIKDIKLNQVGELDIKGADSVKRVYGLDGLCPTMTTMGGGNRQPKVLEPTVAIKSATKRGYEVATKNDSINFTHPGSTTRRGRVGVGVAQTLDCACNQGVMESSFFKWSIVPLIHRTFRLRKLTPIECFRLMGMKDEDIVLVNSNSQSYKIAGNGIEINTMRSIIRQLYKPTKPKDSLF